MLTSMKTWSFLSNYKGVCSVFLWGCPAALLTLWGLCFSHYLPAASLSFSPAPFLRICTPPNPCSFLPLNWRTCVLFIHLLLTSFFLYPLLFFSHLYSVLSPSLSVSPTQSHTLSVSLSVSRIVSPFGFGLFAVWKVLLLILCGA